MTRGALLVAINEVLKGASPYPPPKGASMPTEEFKASTRDDAYKAAIGKIAEASDMGSPTETIPIWIVMAMAEMFQEGFDAGVASQTTENAERAAERIAAEHRRNPSSVDKAQGALQRPPRFHGLPAPIGPEVDRVLARGGVSPDWRACLLLMANTIDALGRHMAMDV